MAKPDNDGLPRWMQVLVALMTLFISIMQLYQQSTLDELDRQLQENRQTLERQVAQNDFLDRLLTRIETYLNDTADAMPAAVCRIAAHLGVELPSVPEPEDGFVRVASPLNAEFHRRFRVACGQGR